MPSGSNVRLRFNTFELELKSRCSYDFVVVRDGASSGSTLIGKYCGNTRPNVTISTGRALYVTFKSDGSVTKRGFSASYIAVSPTTSPPGRKLQSFIRCE